MPTLRPIVMANLVQQPTTSYARVSVAITSLTRAYLARGSARNIGEFPGKFLTQIALPISSNACCEGELSKGFLRSCTQACLRETQLGAQSGSEAGGEAPAVTEEVGYGIRYCKVVQRRKRVWLH